MFSSKSALKSLANLSKALNGAAKIPSHNTMTIVRGKRTLSDVSPATQRIVNSLSAMGGTKRIPYLLRLCPEDYARHTTIMNAWNVFEKNKKEKRHEVLQQQYDSIYDAMEDLNQINEYLFESSNNLQKGKRFPIELRIPTEYPPTKPWFYNYKPKTKEEEN